MDDGKRGGVVSVARRVWVGNLAWETSWQDLKDHFNQVGNVLYADVMKEENGRRSKGCGIVEFETSEQAAAAINTMNDTELKGRPVIVREDREDKELLQALGNDGTPRADRRPGQKRERMNEGPRAPRGGSGGGDREIVVARRIYVGNLAWETNWQDLKTHFANVGNVVFADVTRDANGRSKGWGVVEFETSVQAADAINTMNESSLGGRSVIVREEREDKELKDHLGDRGGGRDDTKRNRPARHENHGHGDLSSIGRRLFVGNLSWQVSWQEMKDHFKQCGMVVYADIMKDSTGRSKGCGIIEFDRHEEAQDAMQRLNGTTLDGRQIFIREDREDRDLK